MRRVAENQPAEKPLSRFPAIERIAVMRQQMCKFRLLIRDVEDDRRGKIAQQRGRRRGGDVLEHEALFGSREPEYARGLSPQIEIAAVRPDQPDRHGNQIRLFFYLSRRGRT
ncbi:hypothetical protein AGMMS50256_06110 [Betaproteobacteria bacterium]|nr:hypothetical protein AGMMS50256_06110 [Betaproteobacteria bacterium]